MQIITEREIKERKKILRHSLDILNSM